MKPISQGNNHINQKLLKFCSEHKRIFLYGAGLYGKKYLSVLEGNHIIIDGFIVTRKEFDIFCDKKVYEAQEINKRLDIEDGVIATFKGATEEIIRKELPDWAGDILIISDMEIEQIYVERIMSRYCDKYRKIAKPLKIGETYSKILLIRLDYLGDLICTTPLIRELRYNYPEAEITIIIRKQYLDIIKNCPYIDKFLLYDSEILDFCNNIYLSYEYLEEIIQKTENYVMTNLGDARFDLVILPWRTGDSLFRWEGDILASSVNTKYILKRFNKGMPLGKLMYNFFKDKVSLISFHDEECKHESCCELAIIEDLGGSIENDEMELWLEDIWEKTANELYTLNGFEKFKTIILGIVGSVKAKNWDVLNYIELINSLNKQYNNCIKFIILGGKDAIESAEKIESACENICNMTDKTTLGETMAIIKKADLYIGSDTGMMHMVSAFRKPAVVLFRSIEDSADKLTDQPERWGPRGSEKSISLQPVHGLDGCTKICMKPYAHCINQITVAEVVTAVNSILLTINERAPSKEYND